MQVIILCRKGAIRTNTGLMTVSIVTYFSLFEVSLYFEIYTTFAEITNCRTQLIDCNSVLEGFIVLKKLLV